MHSLYMVEVYFGMARSMAETLDADTVSAIKASAPALAIHGTEIVRQMYTKLFEQPAIRDLFNQSHQQGAEPQVQALALAVLAYARNIDKPSVLAQAVERVAQKHIGFGIQPEHYPAVGQALLGALQQVLGQAATPTLVAAWGKGYSFLADILMSREAQLYARTAGAEGGWTGWRDFVIAETRPESVSVKSFILYPTDRRPVLRHKPGQYLTFSLDVPGHHTIKRNYSISSGPNGEHYRITVKRESGGIASTWLHDQVVAGTILKAMPPAGDFFLGEESHRPVVLLSGGVGLTPMIAMMEQLHTRQPELSVHWAHGTQDASTHAMRSHIRALAAGRPNVKVTTFYENPKQGDHAGSDGIRAGMIDGPWLDRETPIDEAEYFLCGPRPFLRTLVRALSELGVTAERIRYEFFGPADEILEN